MKGWKTVDERAAEGSGRAAGRGFFNVVCLITFCVVGVGGTEFYCNFTVGNNRMVCG